jgi:putative membrane protein
VTFTQHMAWHMLLLSVIAPLAALALRGTRFDPVRTAPAAFPPIVACLIEFLVVWGWHAPPLHDAARHHTGWFVAEQLSFAAAAFFLWISILGGDARARLGRAGEGVVALAATFAHMTMLGVVIALAPRPLYSHSGAALVDQQFGGAVMIVAGTVTLPLAALRLSRSLVAGEDRP